MSRKCTSELRVRLTDTEHERLNRNAHDCGLTVSDYVRKLLHGEPPILRPKQDAIGHFRSLQQFREGLLPVLYGMPTEKRGQILSALDGLLLESKRMI